VLTCVAVLLLPAQSRVIFLDVGQGSATLVQKGSYGLLIDTSDKSVVLRDLRWYGIRHLGLIISHDDKDHNGMQDQVTRSFHPMLMDPYEGDVVNLDPSELKLSGRLEECMVRIMSLARWFTCLSLTDS